MGNRKPRWRAARRREMKERGITPANRQEVWCVEPSAIRDLPDWVANRIVPGLGSSSTLFWLRPYDAKRLLALDRLCGGRSRFTKTEFRHCEVCRRPLISNEAAERRKLVESGPQARELPCGPNCEQDRETGLWTILAALTQGPPSCNITAGHRHQCDLSRHVVNLWSRCEPVRRDENAKSPTGRGA